MKTSSKIPRRDLWPDPHGVSCYAAFNHSRALPSIVSRDGHWRHIAATWTAANNGLTRIYVDGLLRAETPTGKTTPLLPGGALMLGAEQVRSLCEEERPRARPA